MCGLSNGRMLAIDEVGNAVGRAGLGTGKTGSSTNRHPGTEIE